MRQPNSVHDAASERYRNDDQPSSRFAAASATCHPWSAAWSSPESGHECRKPPRQSSHDQRAFVVRMPCHASDRPRPDPL
jgi:hypothetical protein